jgi:hypothetical protein
MNLKRMQFAAARGARIQRDYVAVGYMHERTENNDGWRDVDIPLDVLALPGPEGSWRIHPDDEHLQYGPVSTAFRDMALFTDSGELPEEVELFMDMAGCNWVLEADGEDPVLADWTRLFFAEYLADLGL